MQYGLAIFLTKAARKMLMKLTIGWPMISWPQASSQQQFSSTEKSEIENEDTE
jgi:hypothetical protein